jgi:hypothetical protein
LVTSAQSEPIDEAIWFRRTLAESRFPFAGVVINRVHHDLLADGHPDDVATLLTGELSSALVSRVLQNLHDYHVLARRDERNIARLRSELEDQPLLLVPHLDEDVHDVEGLLRVHRYLFASPEEQAALIAGVVS